MLTQKELEAAVRKMIANLDEVNLYFIQKIATQIKKIGEMNPTSIHRYAIMLEMGADVADISGKLQAATRLTQQQMAVVYNTALQDNFTDPRFKAALAAHPLPREENQRLIQYMRNIAAQTSGALQNLSNTTAISVPYQQAIDKAILSVSTGMTDYKSAMRQTIKDIGWAGMQVQYASGYYRRLDTAARQNIIDGACQIAQHSADEIGKVLGYDAVELSAHLNSAPDHELVQGHVFLLAEYAKMQAGMACVDVDGHHFAGFKRPIGEWNCGHFAAPFSTEYSVRKYSDHQLAAWITSNHAGVNIGNKEGLTLYQCSQMMRKIETDTRRWKDVAIAARAADDDDLRREAQQHINALSARYNLIANQSGLSQRRDRMAVDGFKAIKVSA